MIKKMLMWIKLRMPVSRAQELADIKAILEVIDGINMNEGQLTQLLYGLIKRIEALEGRKMNTSKGKEYHGIEYG